MVMYTGCRNKNVVPTTVFVLCTQYVYNNIKLYCMMRKYTENDIEYSAILNALSSSGEEGSYKDLKSI